MNELENLTEFESVLSNYEISGHARSVLAKTQLLLLAGVTSSGRNTVVNELLKTGSYHYIISDTTRKPRINHGKLEQNGQEYWFKTEAQFLKGLRDGDYLEAAIIHQQQVSGISINEIERAAAEKKIATTDIEIVGVRNIVRSKPDTICVFMIPPNFNEWLRRIQGRGDMSKGELKRRLSSAVIEIKDALDQDYFYIVVNDEFHQTARVISSIFNHKPEQDHARTVADQLLLETIQYIDTH